MKRSDLKHVVTTFIQNVGRPSSVNALAAALDEEHNPVEGEQPDAVSPATVTSVCNELWRSGVLVRWAPTDADDIGSTRFGLTSMQAMDDGGSTGATFVSAWAAARDEREAFFVAQLTGYLRRYAVRNKLDVAEFDAKIKEAVSRATQVVATTQGKAAVLELLPDPASVGTPCTTDSSSPVC